MKLYAGRPDWAASYEIELFLADTDEDALEHGRYIAAQDSREHGSLTATVYVVGDLTALGTVAGRDCPHEWATDAVAGAEQDVAESLGAEALAAIYARTTHPKESK